MTRLFATGRRREAERLVLRALTSGDAYGWDLRGATKLSSRRLERALERLQEAGEITSRLAESPAGPPVRLYSIVPRQRAHPEEQ